MKFSVVSYSLENQAPTFSSWKEELKSEILNQIENGSDIILYPELFLMGITNYIRGDLSHQLSEIARLTMQDLLPELTSALKDKEVLVCLGSGPRLFEGKLRNTSYVWNQGSWHFQDKIHLTPWETDFTPGNSLQRFRFRGFNLATVICFDIEQLFLGHKLKEYGVDIVLVPSATTDRNGNNRVNRCASARSVELGAVVVTSPLVGKSDCDLVDANEGRQGFFLPSQAATSELNQEQFSEYSSEKKVIQHFEVPVEVIRALKVKDSETKPYFKEEIQSVVVQIK